MELEEYISETTEYVSIRDQSQTGIHLPLIENRENAAISSLSIRNQDALQAIDYHLISEKELFIRYGTERKAGLSSDEAQRRLKRDGPNVVMPKRNILGIILKYVSPFFFGFGFIFWPAVILSILSYKPLGNPHPNVVYLIQAGIFVFVIMANGLVIIMQDFASNQLMNSIAKMLPSTAKLIRNGNNVKIDIKDIVVGDIVQLNVGDIVPADMRLIEISGLKLDTSMLTGESNHMLCNVHSVDSNIMETKNVAFMGTKCVEGHAIGVVTNTGNRTIMGSITRNVSKEKEAISLSSLKNEVNRFVIIIALISILIGLGFLFVWAIWLKTKHPGFISASEMIAISLAAGIAIIPDLLPLFFVILLSLITYKMARKKIVVKHLMTAETLGSVNVICSDKTGTLTQNRMFAMHLYIGQTLKIIDDNLRELYPKNVLLKEMIRACALCNHAKFENPTDTITPIIERSVMGDPSESALLRFAEEFENVEGLRREYTMLAEIPFNSRNKWMLTIFKQPEYLKDKRALLIVKGAPEVLIEKCSSILKMNGESSALTQHTSNDLAHMQEELGNKGERVLAVCCRYLEEDKYPVDSFQFCAEEGKTNFPTDGLFMIGLISMLDKPRPEALSTIVECRKAGIRFSMITGDHPTTAVSIGRMVGIVNTECHRFSDCRHLANDFFYSGDKRTTPSITDASLLVTGQDIYNGLQSHEWDFILAHNELIFARTSPEHKLEIIKQFQKRRNIISVIGDGTNDAPAIKQSDVGIAMGVGTDIARDSADLILMDNNLSSIIEGIKYGRLIYENLRKLLIYLLPGGSILAIIANFFNTFLGTPKMISPILLICYSLFSNPFLGISLLFEQPEPDIMKHAPRSVTGEHLINLKLLLQSYVFIGLPQALCALSMWFWFQSSYGGFKLKDLFFLFNRYQNGFYNKTEDELRTLEFQGYCVFFLAMVIGQLANLFATRTRRSSFFIHAPYLRNSRNIMFFVGIFISLVGTIMIITLPVCRRFLSTRLFPLKYWFAPLSFFLLIFVLDELRKFVVRLLFNPELFLID